MLKKRASGILLHISSLPGPYGVGDFGPQAYAWVDFLAETRQTYWQLLPINPTDGVYGHSPYSSPSAFAINPLFLSPDLLLKEGWISESDLEPRPRFLSSHVDYWDAVVLKRRVIQKTFANFIISPQREPEFEKFCEEQKSWVDDYALFSVLKDYCQSQEFSKWPAELRDRNKEALRTFKEEQSENLRRVKFTQFLLYRQWQQLRDYCRKKKVVMIGDIPIYVNDDSADVWANPQIFKLTDEKKPAVVAGVPPDYFSETGQRWGNPVFDWDKMQESNFAWWKGRLRHNLKLFDVIRIDHFRGFEAFWEIPASERTAVKGQWVKAPGQEFFESVKKDFNGLPFIAEDLGVITPEVTALMNQFNFPGMKILLFAFGGNTDTHPYIPKNYASNCVVYSGTHDNNTARGWFDQDASAEEKQNLFRYLGREVVAAELSWILIKLAFASVANTAIIPLQDILSLGADARMNKPGTAEGNWRWRLRADDLTQHVKEKLFNETVYAKRDGRG